MTTDTLIAIALAALLLFWAVGAHNRLVRLKNAVGQAYAQIDLQLRQWQELLARLSEAADRFDAEPLAGLVAACREMQVAMDAMRLRPSGGPQALALQAAERRLDDQLAALWRAPRTPQVIEEDALLRQQVMDLVQFDERLGLLLEPYNQAVAQFNEAAQAFPAWIIAQLAGLKSLPGLYLGQQGAARLAVRPLVGGRREGDAALAASDL